MHKTLAEKYSRKGTSRKTQRQIYVVLVLNYNTIKMYPVFN